MSDPDNIVLVTVDSWRADYCGFMGGSNSHTPAMDRMASEGLVFENAIAPGPATTDSMPVSFSGDFYPRPDPEWSAIDDPDFIRNHMRARETIPERLVHRGYETAAFTTNPWTSRRYGFDEGFDHFEDFMGSETTKKGPLEGYLDRLLTDEDGGSAIKPVQLLLDWRQQNDMFQSWETFYDDIIAWTEQASEPYFLWIFLVDAHMPFFPIDEFRSQSRLETILTNLWLYLGNDRFESMFGGRLETAYGDTVRYVDDRFGQLTTDLEASDPVFIVHGDHGEEFGERGVYGHGQNLSEELIKVPLLIVNGPSGRVRQPFSLADLPKLIERLADRGSIEDLARPFVQSRNFDPKTAVRGADWKYVVSENDEHLYTSGSECGENEMVHRELQLIGQDVTSKWQQESREREQITRSAQEIVTAEQM